MSWRTLCNNNVTRAPHNSYTIRIQQLSIPFSALAELKLETSLFVKDLDTMVVGISYDNVILCVYSNPAGLSELAF